MDNKYGLGSAKVATEHLQSQQKQARASHAVCRFCYSTTLVHCATMQDHRCASCGEWQMEVMQSYTTGRNSDY